MPLIIRSCGFAWGKEPLLLLAVKFGGGIPLTIRQLYTCLVTKASLLIPEMFGGSLPSTTALADEALRFKHIGGHGSFPFSLLLASHDKTQADAPEVLVEGMRQGFERFSGHDHYFVSVTASTAFVCSRHDSTRCFWSTRGVFCSRRGNCLFSSQAKILFSVYETAFHVSWTCI